MEEFAVDGPGSSLERMALGQYLLDRAYDEMFAAEKQLHPHYSPLVELLTSMPREEIQRRKQEADLSFLNQGITFTVYGRGGRNGADLSVRSAAAHHHRRGVGARGARADAAHYGAEPVSEGHL